MTPRLGQMQDGGGAPGISVLAAPEDELTMLGVGVLWDHQVEVPVAIKIGGNDAGRALRVGAASGACRSTSRCHRPNNEVPRLHPLALDRILVGVRQSPIEEAVIVEICADRGKAVEAG